MKKRLFNLLLLLVFGGVVSVAQVTDSQLIKILQQHEERGSTQGEIMEDLYRRGITYQRLKQLEMKLGSGGKSAAKAEDAKEDAVATDGRSFDEEDEPVAVANSSSIFGQNLFGNKSLTFSPSGNIPVPDDYVLGAGDELIVDMWGNSELSETQVLSPEGDVVLSDVGRIQLAGLTMKEAAKRVKTSYTRVYSDIRSGGTQIKVSLGKLRSIKVNILGEVNTPGTYTVAATSSVFHALYIAGGVTDIGSLRNIVVYRNGKALGGVDVYEYLIKGGNDKDVVLTDGDVVLVGTFDILVNVQGAVKRPMKYELKQGETIKDLLVYAGGFSDKAFTQNLQISRIGSTEHQFYTVEEGQYASFELKNGDNISVTEVLPEYSNQVHIYGAVYREGYYAIDEKIKTVGDLIKVAGGLKGDANQERVILYRTADDMTRESESFSAANILSGTVEDIELRKRDELFVPSILSALESQYVAISGAVKNPGQYTFYKNMCVGDIILRAGDLLESAYKAKIDIYRRTMDEKSSDATGNVDVFSFSLLPEDAEQTNSFKLEPYDEIFVYNAPGYQTQMNVSIEGEVSLPGTYSLISKEEKLSSLIERAGGFRANANIKGCRIVRRMDEYEIARTKALIEKVKRDEIIQNDSINPQLIEMEYEYSIGVDFEKIQNDKDGVEDIILREGDRIIVPSYNDIVRISGAVAYPNATPYVKGQSISSYIDLAGGYEYRAAKCKKYVVYMNGKTRKLRFSSQIKPGSEIIVPFKRERKNDLTTAQAISITTSTVSMLSVVATLVIALTKK